jgi:hypothetical protein
MRLATARHIQVQPNWPLVVWTKRDGGWRGRAAHIEEQFGALTEGRDRIGEFHFD